MSRFRIPEILLGCFLTIAVFATGMLFNGQQSAPPQQAGKHQEAASQSHKPESPDAELTGSTWLTKDAAGFFTFGLVVVGVFQALLFFVQLSYMRKGMEDATIAANAARDGAIAAKLQATSNISAERPYVFLKITENGIHWTLDGKFEFSGSRLRFELRNYGRTPALLLELKEWAVVVEGVLDGPPPIDPLKDRGILLPIGSVAASNGSGDPMAVNLLGSAENFQRLIDKDGWKSCRLFFCGFVRFSDAFGNYYITGFQLVFSPIHNAWALRGGENYNYTRQEKAEAIPPHPDYPGEKV